MYLPEDNHQLFDILRELQHYAEAEGMAELSEVLMDATVLAVSEAREQKKRTLPSL